MLGWSAVIAAFPQPSGRFIIYLILPAVAEGFDAVEPRDVRFDIKKRRAVEDIHAIEVKNILFSAHQFYNAQTDCVGAGARSCGKNPSFNVLQKGLHDEFCSSRQMEVVNQVNVREAIEVSQALFIFGEYLRPSTAALRICWLNRCLLSNGMLAIYDADGFVRNATFCHFTIL